MAENSTSGGGCGCFSVIATVIVIWFLIWFLVFGATWGGAHHELSCTRARGVEIK